MCPVFIGSLMKPLSTSFQRFSLVIVYFFPPAFFAGGTPTWIYTNLRRVFQHLVKSRVYTLHCRFRGDLLLSRRSFYYRVVPRLDLISPSSTSLFWTFSSGIATGIYVLRRFKWMDFFGNSPVFASISDWPCWAPCVGSRPTLILILQKLKFFPHLVFDFGKYHWRFFTCLILSEIKCVSLVYIF